MGESDSLSNISERTSSIVGDPASRGDYHSPTPVAASPTADVEDPCGDNDFGTYWGFKTVTFPSVITTLLAVVVSLVIAVHLVPYVCDLA